MYLSCKVDVALSRVATAKVSTYACVVKKRLFGGLYKHLAVIFMK